MKAWALPLLLFVHCGSGTNNAEFAPCSNVACTPVLNRPGFSGDSVS
jgi:hypothetical protein